MNAVLLIFVVIVPLAISDAFLYTIVLLAFLTTVINSHLSKVLVTVDRASPHHRVHARYFQSVLIALQ